MSKDKDPQESGKVSGYTSQSEAAIDLVNRIKGMENQVGDLVEEVKDFLDKEDVALDVWFEGSDLLERGTRDLQVGFMMLVRSVFRPYSRLKP